jgi:hypothetical protein
MRLTFVFKQCAGYPLQISFLSANPGEHWQVLGEDNGVLSAGIVPSAVDILAAVYKCMN